MIHLTEGRAGAAWQCHAGTGDELPALPALQEAPEGSKPQFPHPGAGTKWDYLSPISAKGKQDLNALPVWPEVFKKDQHFEENRLRAFPGFCKFRV